MGSKTDIAQNATLETVGVSALAGAVVLIGAGQMAYGFGVAIIGVVCFALKYALR